MEEVARDVETKERQKVALQKSIERRDDHIKKLKEKIESLEEKIESLEEENERLKARPMYEG